MLVLIYWRRFSVHPPLTRLSLVQNNIFKPLNVLSENVHVILKTPHFLPTSHFYLFTVSFLCIISEYKMDFISNNEIKPSTISYSASKILQFFFFFRKTQHVERGRLTLFLFERCSGNMSFVFFKIKVNV